MLIIHNKVLSCIVNFFLMIWQFPQLITGIIGLVIFRNYTIYTNEPAKVRVLRVNKGDLFGTACFSSGMFIFVTDDCSEETLRHETGHSIQSLMSGWLYHIVVSIPSICRFWYRRLKNKSHEWYLSGYPEKQAEKLGHTLRSQKKTSEGM